MKQQLIVTFLFAVLTATLIAQAPQKQSLPITGKLLVDNHKTVQDTCAFYLDVTANTTDNTGLLLNGTDLTEALLWTRCDCNTKDILAAPTENFVTFATYYNAVKLVTVPHLQTLITVWRGNSTKAVLQRQRK